MKFQIGDRVQAGQGDDRDTGRIMAIIDPPLGACDVWVAWDSGTRTPAISEDLASEGALATRRWFMFVAFNTQAQYGYGTELEADRYCDFLNRGREVNQYHHQEVEADVAAHLDSGDNTESFELDATLDAIAERDAWLAEQEPKLRAYEVTVANTAFYQELVVLAAYEGEACDKFEEWLAAPEQQAEEEREYEMAVEEFIEGKVWGTSESRELYAYKFSPSRIREFTGNPRWRGEPTTEVQVMASGGNG